MKIVRLPQSRVHAISAQGRLQTRSHLLSLLLGVMMMAGCALSPDDPAAHYCVYEVTASSRPETIAVGQLVCIECPEEGNLPCHHANEVHKVVVWNRGAKRPTRLKLALGELRGQCSSCGSNEFGPGKVILID